jgi:signal transduction histidine kinase
MSRLLQMERWLIRSRRWSWLVVGLVLGILGLAIGLTVQQVREGIRRQLTDREGEVLHAVVVARFEALEGWEWEEDVADPATQMTELLGISRLRGVVGVRLYDPEGRFVDSFPPMLRERDMTGGDLMAMRESGLLSRYWREADIESEFYPAPGAEVGRGGGGTVGTPLHEVYLPLQAGFGAPWVGVAQFLIDGSGLEREFRGLDRRLWQQGGVTFLMAGLILGVALSWAFHRLHEAQRELAERTERLVRANVELGLAARTTALGAVASHLVHGLRSPLAGLQNLVKAAGRSEAAVGEEDWEQAAASMRRMQVLIQEVMQVLREHPVADRYAVTLDEVAALVLKRVEGMMQERGVLVRVEPVADGVLSNRIANLVVLVLRNLVENAVQATPAGGVVRLAVSVGDGGVVWAVRDEGMGISVETQRQLFMPLVSSKEGGSGLGLAISHQLAQHMGGGLRLVQTGDRGTWFELWLPAGVVRWGMGSRDGVEAEGPAAAAN